MIFLFTTTDMRMTPGAHWIVFYSIVHSGVLRHILPYLGRLSTVSSILGRRFQKVPQLAAQVLGQDLSSMVTALLILTVCNQVETLHFQSRSVMSISESEHFTDVLVGQRSNESFLALTHKVMQQELYTM